MLYDGIKIRQNKTNWCSKGLHIEKSLNMIAVLRIGEEVDSMKKRRSDGVGQSRDRLRLILADSKEVIVFGVQFVHSSYASVGERINT
jgi:hypothetical protein